MNSLSLKNNVRAFTLILLFALTTFPPFAPRILAQDNTSSCGNETPQEWAGTYVKFTHQTVLVNGVRFHYVTGGKGDPLLLLHGWPETWYEWRRVMPTLAQHYTLIVPDLPGLGTSSGASNGYSINSIAEDIYRLVSQLGYKQISLVGHDIGGWVAYAYASNHPESVNRLAVLDVFPPNDTFVQYTTLTKQGSLWHFAFHYVQDLPEELIQGKERIYLSWFYKNLAYDKQAISDTDIDVYVRCYSAEGVLHNGFEYYRALFDDIAYVQESAKSKLKMPTLVLGLSAFGESSTLLTQWQNYAANVQVKAVDQSGHWMAEERPDFVATQLIGFLSGS